LVEAREALEPMIAYLAAKNRTENDLAEMHAISARLEAAAIEGGRRFLEENANWHTSLAAASHNDLLRAFTASISALMFDVSQIDNFASHEVRQLVTTAHRRILRAIESQDCETARRRTQRDLEAYAKHLDAAVQASPLKDKSSAPQPPLENP
jgi:GntR family transcriptional repressor for pyruvate dehydrogenase complex